LSWTTAERAEIRHIPVQADQRNQALHKASRLPQRIPKWTFIVRLVWTAAPL
jgi:hypothetical protein